MFVRIRAKREEDKLMFVVSAEMNVGVVNLFRSDSDKENNWRGLSCVR